MLYSTVPPHLRFSVDMDTEEAALQGVDDDQDVAELGGDDAAPVVPLVFRPDHVHLVIAQVPRLPAASVARQPTLLEVSSGGQIEKIGSRC